MSISLDEARFEQEVLASPFPALVHFWAPWCGICRMVTPLLNRLQGEWGDQLRIFDINADENLRLANNYRLTTLPTLLFVDQGKVVHRFEGLQGRDEFKRSLDALMYRRQLERNYHNGF